MPKRYNPQDIYFRKAKDSGFRARSVFKLDEIQERFRMVRRGARVMDIGAAPGSFLQSLSAMVGEKGLVVGIDLQEIHDLELPNVHTFVGDVLDDESMEGIFEVIGDEKFDVITADLAPRTTGIKSVDNYASYELNLAVLEVVKKYLKKGGYMVTKIFTGEEYDDFVHETKTYFGKVKAHKPRACRDRSREVYVVGMKYNGEK